jgi:hypothetical protein
MTPQLLARFGRLHAIRSPDQPPNLQIEGSIPSRLTIKPSRLLKRLQPLTGQIANKKRIAAARP